MRNVLVIAYYFPPLGLSGVQRTLKFIKYLPSYGWKPTVLTVDDRGYFAKDGSLIEDLAGLDIEVVRTPSLDPLHFFRKRSVVRMPSSPAYSVLSTISQALFIPDNKIGWKRKAVAAGRAVMQRTPFDIIYATAPPYTDFLIGAALKRLTGVPLVFDYRDAWLENPLHKYVTPLHRVLHRRMETAALRYADHVVTINRSIKEQTLLSAANISHHDVTIIPQGFDSADFPTVPPRRHDRVMRITYAGTFYINRTPKFLFKALRMLKDEDPDMARHIELRIIGTPRASDRALAGSIGVGDLVHFDGYLPHQDCVNALCDSDVLWVMIGTGPGEAMMSTGKLYEYIGARRTILATVPEGEAQRTLARSGAAFVAPPEDVPAITAQLRALYTKFKNDSLPRPSEQYVTQFDRRTLTGELARVFARAMRLGPHESLVTRATPPGTTSQS